MGGKAFTMKKNKPSWKRRQFLVGHNYQIRFVTRIFMAVFGIALASSLIATAIIMFNMHQPELESSQALLIAALVAVATTLIIELLIAIPVVYLFGIRQSHRVIGPMKRILRALDAIGSGDFSQRLTLRQGDALIELGQHVNRMAEQLKQRFPSSR